MEAKSNDTVKVRVNRTVRVRARPSLLTTRVATLLTYGGGVVVGVVNRGRLRRAGGGDGVVGMALI